MGKLFVLIVFGIMLSVARVVIAGSLEDAFAAANRGDFATALRLWRPLAQQGHAPAQSNLGYMYEKGDGVPRDYQEAVAWYRKSAQQGHAKGQLNLGTMYYSGHGVPQDYQEAVAWYRKAAQQGHPQAQLELGTMYYNGHGIPRDYVRAHMWSSLAASLLSGEHSKNNRDLIAWPMTLEQIKADGKTASDNRALVARKMTPAQIERAREMARLCKASNYKQCD